MKQEEETDNL